MPAHPINVRYALAQAAAMAQEARYWFPRGGPLWSWLNSEGR